MIEPRDIGAVAARALTTSGHERKIYELSGQADLSRSFWGESYEGGEIEFWNLIDDWWKAGTFEGLLLRGAPVATK